MTTRQFYQSFSVFNVSSSVCVRSNHFSNLVLFLQRIHFFICQQFYIIKKDATVYVLLIRVSFLIWSWSRNAKKSLYNAARKSKCHWKLLTKTTTFNIKVIFNLSCHLTISNVFNSPHTTSGIELTPFMSLKRWRVSLDNFCSYPDRNKVRVEDWQALLQMVPV